MLTRLRARQHDGWQADDDFGGWVKTTVLFLAVSGPQFVNFWDDVGDHSYFSTPFLIVSIVFLTADNGPQSCH